MANLSNSLTMTYHLQLLYHYVMLIYQLYANFVLVNSVHGSKCYPLDLQCSCRICSYRKMFTYLFCSQSGLAVLNRFHVTTNLIFLNIRQKSFVYQPVKSFA